MCESYYVKNIAYRSLSEGGLWKQRPVPRQEGARIYRCGATEVQRIVFVFIGWLVFGPFEPGVDIIDIYKN